MKRIFILIIFFLFLQPSFGQIEDSYQKKSNFWSVGYLAQKIFNSWESFKDNNVIAIKEIHFINSNEGLSKSEFIVNHNVDSTGEIFESFYMGKKYDTELKTWRPAETSLKVLHQRKADGNLNNIYYAFDSNQLMNEKMADSIVSFKGNLCVLSSSYCKSENLNVEFYDCSDTIKVIYEYKSNLLKRIRIYQGDSLIEQIEYLYTFSWEEELLECYNNGWFDLKFTFEQNSEKFTSYDTIMFKLLIKYLMFNDSLSVGFLGYTDRVGTVSNNLVLGEKRASQVKSLFVQNGILESRIIIKSLGESENKNANVSSSRRVEIWLW